MSGLYEPVWIGPGEITFTVMPKRPSSCAAERVYASSACLLAPYETCAGKRPAPSVLTLMMRPRGAPRSAWRRANSATLSATARLVPAIRQVLEAAIAAGGSSLRDYVQANGELGYFQHAWRAYGREGEPCGREGCTGVIRRITQSGRSTFYCAARQR